MSWDQLREQIERRLSLDEVRTLCFDLGEEYDSLPGDAKPAKVRELIAHFRRIGKVPALINYLKRVRPQIAWDDIQLDDPPPRPIPQTPPQPPQQAAPTQQPNPTGQASSSPQPASTSPGSKWDWKNWSWRNWGDNPIVVIIGLVAAIVGTIAGIQSILGQMNSTPTPIATIALSTTVPALPTDIVEPTPDRGAIANTAAAATATAIFATEGTRAAATATAAVVTPEATPGIGEQFRDDFDGPMSAEWISAKPGFVVGNGHLQGASTGTTMFVINREDANYTINTDIQGGNFWVLFRASLNAEKNDLSQGYAFACGVNSCVMVKILPDKSVLISAEVIREGFSVREFHDISITIDGAEFVVYVDGETFMTVSDISFTSGGVGIAVVPMNADYTGGIEVDYFEVLPRKS